MLAAFVGNITRVANDVQCHSFIVGSDMSDISTVTEMSTFTQRSQVSRVALRELAGSADHSIKSAHRSCSEL